MKQPPKSDVTPSYTPPRRLGPGGAVAVQVAAVLGDSHRDYPGFRAAFPDPGRRARALRPFLRAIARDALRHGFILGCEDDGQLSAVAIWLEPGDFPWSAARKLSSAPALFGTLRTAPRDFRRFVSIGAASERAFPDEELWYLETMGVRAAAQGRGLGASLMRTQLSTIDGSGVDAYLETSDVANVAFYRRFGFEPETTFDPIPGGPTYTGLRRSSRS